MTLFWTNFYNLYLSKTIGPIEGQVLDSVFSRILFTLQASASSPSLANHFGMAASNSFFSISEDDPVNSSPTKTGTELVVYQKNLSNYSNNLPQCFNFTIFFKQETFPAWT